MSEHGGAPSVGHGGAAMTWSWTVLLRVHAGDEERALRALSRQRGLGEYEDEAHPIRRSHRQDQDPVVGAPVCPAGHPMWRNGRRDGRQRWLCRPCGRSASEQAVAAGGAS